MGTFNVHGVSPSLPIDDMLTHPEGGADAAVRAAATLLPGAGLTLSHTGTLADPGVLAPGDLALSTHGPTTVILGDARGLEIPMGMTHFEFSYQPVSMAHAIEVTTPAGRRLVAVSPGRLDHQEGDPLPFEERFRVSEYTPGAEAEFDDDAYAAAAMRWMFGYHPAGPAPDDRVDPAQAPAHILRVAPGDEATAVSVERRPEPRAGLLGRLLRRR